MKREITRPVIGVVLVLLLNSPSSYSQAVTVHAGTNRVIDWDKTHSVQLEGRVSPEKAKVQWTCAQNPEVRFTDASRPATVVSFPRPGYYLLVLAMTGPRKDAASSSLIVNVCKAHSYRERLSDLIGLMTLEEKTGQLTNESDSIPRLGLRKYNYWSEALHGVMGNSATSFPQAVGMGSTWEPELLYRVGTAISDEARALNVVEGKGLTYWSPTINIARDPRWGRNEESYSEDPYLLSRMAVSFVKGMQGNDPYYLKAVSTPKHFMANNEEGRRHTGSSDVDMRSMWEYYLPAFRAAVVEGKAYSIMGAYNEVNHVPCNANSFLLTDLLRRTWGFEGYVVSDCGAVSDMVYGHHFYKTGPEAAAGSILAGCDLDCGSEYRRDLGNAVAGGLLQEKDLDRALERVLSARFRLGEFDPPEMVPYSAITKARLDCQEHRDLALEVARKSIVLLKNNGTLPLSREKVKSIAVIGPNAEGAQLGIYSGWPNLRLGALEGIQAKAGVLGIRVDHTMGCGISSSALRPIEARYFANVEGTGRSGLKGEYFDNMNLSGKPLLTRVDSMVNFNYGTGSPAPGLPVDHFSVRWKGKIVPPDTIYALGTSTDDGVRLYLDGKLIIDDWTDHAETPDRASVKMIPGKEYEVEMQYFEDGQGACARLTWDFSGKDFGDARAIAAKADVVVLVLGTSPEISREELDRTSIDLPLVQRDLIAEIASVNPNIVIVLENGGPVALAGAENKAAAIVEAWYPGELGGAAIADVLFGDVNPGGKLPETFYASTGQLPPMSDYDLINHPRTYMYLEQPVLFPFGHGLSYTRFAYDGLGFASGTVGRNGEAELHFTVRNTGNVKGDEVAQVYVHALNAGRKVPIVQLKRFQRVTLAPGESRTLTFRIPASEFSFYDTNTNGFIIEPGAWEVSVGSSSRDIRQKGSLVIE